MKTINPNKAISANMYGINVYYADSHKSFSLSYNEGSPLKNLQLKGNKYKKEISFQPEVIELLNNTYKRLYNEVMYGLTSFTQEEIKGMTFNRKMSIVERYEQAQYYLNLWKQEIIHQKIGSFLTTIFHKSEFAKALAHYPKSISPWDRSSTITFKELGIRKEQIIEKLIDLGLLPINCKLIEI